MNSPRRLLGVVLAVVFLVAGLSAVLFIPAHGASINTVDISSYISGQASWITYDSANNVAYIGVGVSQSNLYKINLATVLTSPATSITAYTSFLGSACGGSLAFGPGAGVALNGSMWFNSWYSDNQIGVSKVTNGVLKATYCYNGPTDARAIGTDGTYLIVGVQGAILKMTQAGVFSSLASLSGDVKDLKLNGSTVWFAQSGSTALGKVNLDGTGLSQFNCGCDNAAFLSIIGASVYFSDNVNHNLVKYDGSTFTAYPTGWSGDTTHGPYGLTYSSSKNAIIVNGYADLSIKTFYLANASFGATATSTTKKPFMGFGDASGNVWSMALGSTQLIQIPATTQTYTLTGYVSNNCSVLTQTCYIVAAAGQYGSSTSTTTTASTSSAHCTSSYTASCTFTLGQTITDESTGKTGQVTSINADGAGDAASIIYTNIRSDAYCNGVIPTRAGGQCYGSLSY